jgi:hypothetical protein
MKVEGALRPIELPAIVKGALVLLLNFIGAPSVMPLSAAYVPLNGTDTCGIPLSHGLGCLKEILFPTQTPHHSVTLWLSAVTLSVLFHLRRKIVFSWGQLLLLLSLLCQARCALDLTCVKVVVLIFPFWWGGWFERGLVSHVIIKHPWLSLQEHHTQQ